MFTLYTIVPAVVEATGLPVAVTIAVAVTALAGLGMVVWSLHSSAKLTRLRAVVSASTALVILVGAVAFGGLLTRPPAANADEDHPSRAAAQARFELKLSGLQLPTL
ncbi:MAG: hypothetical protein H7226_05450 [Salinibacterium sp.]|nr:hypothetical protein [Salinibacterium sp.]